MSQTRSRSRSAARLAAVQALYQHDMEGTPVARLLKEFHDHRLGASNGRVRQILPSKCSTPCSKS
jgi:transcription antitermination protein NusB